MYIYTHKQNLVVSLKFDSLISVYQTLAISVLNDCDLRIHRVEWQYTSEPTLKNALKSNCYTLHLAFGEMAIFSSMLTAKF